jgi:hypothetical protein
MSPDPTPPRRSFPEVLQERLLNFAAGVCDQARRIQHDLVSASMVQQLIRAASSVAANYAEARAAFVMDTWNAEALVAMPQWQAGVLDRTSAGTNRPQ